jgi:hypothetical protein
MNTMLDETDIVFLQILQAGNTTTPAAAAAPATAPAATNATTAPGAAPAQVGDLKTNVVGRDRPGSQIESYNITNCDQVVLISAERVKDHKDYLSREPAFFTMSAYLLNMFSTKDASKLLESINLSHVRIFPHVLLGTKNCLRFTDDVTSRNITLCLKDADTLNDVKDLYEQFMTCRAGKDFKDVSKIDIQALLRATCGGTNTGKIDIYKVKVIFAEELRKNGFNVTEKGNPIGTGVESTSTASLNFTDGPMIREIRVPGTPIPEFNITNGDVYATEVLY